MAVGKKYKDNLTAEKNTLFANNTTQDISAADLRTNVESIIDSYASTVYAFNSGTNSGTININMDIPHQVISLGGNVTVVNTFDGSRSQDVDGSQDLGRTCKVFFKNTSGNNYGWSFNSAWSWLGTWPSGLAPSTNALLIVASFGNTEADVIASIEVLTTGLA